MPNLPLDMLPREVQSAIKKAEREDGYRYGGAVYDDGDRGWPCFVSVQFHPKRQWFVTLGAEPPRRLTPELYARIERLKL